MDYNEIIQLISSTGFPIIMCLLMFKNNTEITQMIGNNTKVLELLKESIDSLLRREDERK